MIKLQITAGKANPAPPVGPALGQHGLNIQDFCTKFNEATKDKGNDIGYAAKLNFKIQHDDEISIKNALNDNIHLLDLYYQ